MAMSRTDGVLIGTGAGLVIGALAAWLARRYMTNKETDDLIKWGASQPEPEIQAATKDLTTFSAMEIGASLTIGGLSGLGAGIAVGLLTKSPMAGLAVGLIVAAVAVAGILMYDRYYNEKPELQRLKAGKKKVGMSTGERDAGTSEEVVVPIVPFFPPPPEAYMTEEPEIEIIPGTQFMTSTETGEKVLEGIGEAASGAVGA